MSSFIPCEMLICKETDIILYMKRVLTLCPYCETLCRIRKRVLKLFKNEAQYDRIVIKFST